MTLESPRIIFYEYAIYIYMVLLLNTASTDYWFADACRRGSAGRFFILNSSSDISKFLESNIYTYYLKTNREDFDWNNSKKMF